MKYTSVIALCSIAYLVILVVAHYIKGDTLEERGEVRVFEWAGPVAVLAAFPVMVFAYTCHQNVSFSVVILKRRCNCTSSDFETDIVWNIF